MPLLAAEFSKEDASLIENQCKDILSWKAPDLPKFQFMQPVQMLKLVIQELGDKDQRLRNIDDEMCEKPHPWITEAIK